MKFRHEFKYLASKEQLYILQNRICAMMKLDAHVGEKGQYQIRSLYFDDYDNNCYYENEDGVDYRKKYRIRIYNASDQKIMLECKHKIHGKTWKEAQPISKEIYEAILDQSIVRKVELWNSAGEAARTAKAGQSSLLQTFLTDLVSKMFRPKVIVEYDRMPFVYPLGNVRVTFDRNIAASENCDLFFESNCLARPILQTGCELLEVKYDEYLPDMIYQALNLNQLKQSTFSKYYLCAKAVQQYKNVTEWS